ncbi:MAG: DUF1553 domain-containing protein [Gemmataceae bacterium]|nr:DUF1553 domain-containing protein [Gemmataceae bacterium]
MPFRLLLILSLLFLFSHYAQAEEPAEYFENKVRPILVEYCQECHGSGKKQKGGLHLDSKAGFEKGGDSGKVVLAGKPKQSRLINAVGYQQELKMPPKSKLPQDKIDTLTRWVEQGAYWPSDKGKVLTTAKGINWEERKKHWAWQGVKNPAIPLVKSGSWSRTPVDRFLLKKLDEKGLTPSPRAGKEALFRRLHFDLNGLPPTPEDLQRYLADHSPGAFDKEVGRLLASPRFGEHWARHWLDLVRYGESRGHEFDYNIPNAFQYRDYVIRAFNADVPYNQFVQEHIAGDLLDQPRLHPVEKWNESILGTGFLFLGEEIHSPVDIRQDQADRYDNRIDVIGKTFFGLTLACARCHDHKFDPIWARDYYSWFGYLESSDYRLVRFQAWENNRSVGEELKKLRESQRAAIQRDLAEGFQKSASRLPALVRAAREVLHSKSPAQGKDEDILFANFESERYEGWSVEGTAFGDGPVSIKQLVRDQKGIRFEGERLVNTHNQKSGGKLTHTDEATGVLTSKPFVIGRDFIAFLIGGGAHPGATCVNLLLDGKVVRTATGKNQNQMISAGWDVRELTGKKAALQIVDTEKGPWGHIGVDHIRFTNQAPDGVGPALGQINNRVALLAIAKTHEVSPELLQRFVQGVISNLGKEITPLDSLAKAMGAKTKVEPKAKAAPLDMKAAFLANPENKVIVDYSALQAGQWRTDGVSFGSGPVPGGQAMVWQEGNQARWKVSGVSAAEFDPFWSGIRASVKGESEPGALGGGRAGRTLSTPSFRLEKDKVFILARGKGRVYASAGSHIMIAGPLHGQILRSFSHEDYGWVALDLARYRGQMLHLEITADTAPFSVLLAGQGNTDPGVKYAAIPAREDRTLDLMVQENALRLRELADFLKSPGAVNSGTALAMAQEVNSWLNSGGIGWGSQGEDPYPASVSNLAKELNQLAATVQWESELGLAQWDGQGIDERVFVRGNHRLPGEPAPRRFLEALHPGLPGGEPGSGRLALAQWMTSPEKNPFITRVMVNRVFKHLFGRGMVASVDNFGAMGESPTHPELLDFLANEMVRQGWSLKELIRLLASSAAYQTGSTPTAQARESDPENLYFSHMPVKRLPGESLRDSLLALGGGINQQMYGPSVSIHLSGFLEGRGRPQSGPLDGESKRSIYQSVRRNFLAPMMVAFDSPIPFSTVGRRSMSNVPAQALIMMNDPFIHQQTEKWAGRILQLEISPEQKIIRMYREAFARDPSEKEMRQCLDFLNTNKNPNPLEVWKDLGHALVNAKEFTWIR